MSSGADLVAVQKVRALRTWFPTLRLLRMLWTSQGPRWRFAVGTEPPVYLPRRIVGSRTLQEAPTRQELVEQWRRASLQIAELYSSVCQPERIKTGSQSSNLYELLLGQAKLNFILLAPFLLLEQ